MGLINYNKIYLILATILVVNMFAGILPVFLTAPLGVALMILAACAWGQKYPDEDAITRISLGILHILTVIILAGSAFFYLFSLGKAAVIICLLIIFWKTKDADLIFKIKDLRSIKISSTFKFQLSTFLLIAGTLFCLLVKSSSDGAITSPWLLLPKYFLPVFFAAAALLIYISAKKSTPALLALFFFLFFSVAAFIYKLGYGFDIFNHEAAVKYILEHGIIAPKPLQYIGLYSAYVFNHLLTSIPVEWMNRFLLPALSALVPPIAFYTAKKTKIAGAPTAVLAILLIPMSYLIVTTPQGFANLFLLFAVLLSFAGHKTWWLAIATALIHPIAGIAAVIFLALKNLKNTKTAFIAGSLAFPLIFVLLSYKTSGQFIINFHIKEAVLEYWNLLTMGGIKKNFNLWLDIFYLIKPLIIPAVVAASLFTAYKYRKNVSTSPTLAFLVINIGFFLTAVFTDFSYLISYEQKNYPERLFFISLLFLAPYLMSAASSFSLFLRKQESKPLKIFFILLFSIVISANFYATYPRRDNYENDKGKNVTTAMISAVKLIDGDAAGKNYVVLTDQAVSAAALKTFGFKKYYKTPLGEAFFYPIPTGGPLYNEFLNLVYDDAGAKATINAQILTGADDVYIALPSYWENYNKIKENLKTEMRIIFEDKDIIILK